MAIAHDATSPAAVTSSNNGATCVTASFTPPAGSRIVANPGDCSTGGLKTFTMSNTGLGGTLTWTKMASNATEACELWISSVVASATAGTVTCTRTGPNAGIFTLVVSVWTGVQSGAISIGSTVVGAVNNGSTSTTNSITPNVITTTVNNSYVIAGDIDDSAAGAMTSTDQKTPVTPASTGDGIFCWKSAPTATSGTVVTMNFDAAGTGAVAHRWCAAELLPAGGASTNQSLTATETQTPTLSTVTSHLLTLSATQTQTPTMARVTAHLKTLSATETQTPTLTASRAFLRTLSATHTQTPTLAEAITFAKTLSATETQTPTMARVTAHLLTLSATETQTPTMAKVTAHLLTITATETQTPTLAKPATHLLTLTATESQTATELASRAFLRSLTATEVQVADLSAVFQAGAVVAVVVSIPPMQHSLNRLAQILDSPLDAQGAANVWAGTTNLELVHALNEKAGTSGLELNGVAKLLALQLSGDPSMDVDGALASIPLPGGAFALRAPTLPQRFAATAQKATGMIKRHKVAASIGGVGFIGSASMLLKGILL